MLLESLLDAPDLPEILQQAERAWAAEQARRVIFLNDITPEHKWEFINGEVIMHSPALKRHLVATGNLYQILFVFAKNGGCGSVYVEKGMTSFPRNDYEPDIIFFGPSKSAGIQPDTLRFPVPDLIVEVLSPSTQKRDRGVKFLDYAKHGVSEYWIVDTEYEQVEIYQLDQATMTYPPTKKVGTGFLESTTMVGLCIPVEAVFDEDVTMQVLREMNADEVGLTVLRNTVLEEGMRREQAERALEQSEKALQQSLLTLKSTEQALKQEREAREALALEMERLKRRLDAGDQVNEG
jgi:Uma2 family endonuclease